MCIWPSPAVEQYSRDRSRTLPERIDRQATNVAGETAGAVAAVASGRQAIGAITAGGNSRNKVRIAVATTGTIDTNGWIIPLTVVIAALQVHPDTAVVRNDD